jgi:hypothetical protein
LVKIAINPGLIQLPTLKEWALLLNLSGLRVKRRRKRRMIKEFSQLRREELGVLYCQPFQVILLYRILRRSL